MRVNKSSRAFLMILPMATGHPAYQAGAIRRSFGAKEYRQYNCSFCLHRSIGVRAVSLAAGRAEKAYQAVERSVANGLPQSVHNSVRKSLLGAGPMITNIKRWQECTRCSTPQAHCNLSSEMPVVCFENYDSSAVHDSVWKRCLTKNCRSCTQRG